MRRNIDIERTYGRKAFIAKLRRLADALERDERFVIQVSGRRVVVPRDAAVSVEYECQSGQAELELQIRWPQRKR